MGDAHHFEERAAVYERARPAYPAQLWACLERLALLREGTRVLELGAGTGQATRPLVDRGAVVTAVEPGEELGRRLRAACPGVTVLRTTAERMEVPEGAFDLAVAATSVHWLDLNVVLPRLHRAVRPGGHFAVWRNAYGDPEVATPFRERVSEIVARRAGPARQGPGELDTREWVARLSAGGFFEGMHTEHFRWSIELDARQIEELFSTFSDWSEQEAAAAGEAARVLGGHVTEHYVTPLMVFARADA